MDASDPALELRPFVRLKATPRHSASSARKNPRSALTMQRTPLTAGGAICLRSHQRRNGSIGRRVRPLLDGASFEPNLVRARNCAPLILRWWTWPAALDCGVDAGNLRMTRGSRYTHGEAAWSLR